MSVVRILFEDNTLHVTERVAGYRIANGRSFSTQVEVETIVRDPDVIREFFCGVAVRAIGKRAR